MVPLPVDSRFLGVLGCTGLEEIIHGFPMMAFEGWYDDLPAFLDATLLWCMSGAKNIQVEGLRWLWVKIVCHKSPSLCAH